MASSKRQGSEEAGFESEKQWAMQCQCQLFSI